MQHGRGAHVMPVPSLDDPCWLRYTNAYRRSYDARPLISALQRDVADTATWDTVWRELLHQGDVGEASYAIVAALPACLSAAPPATALHFAAAVELARPAAGNPEVPPELRRSYAGALEDLPKVMLGEVPGLWSADIVRGVTALVAVAHGQRRLAQVYLGLDETLATEVLKRELGIDGQT